MSSTPGRRFFAPLPTSNEWPRLLQPPRDVATCLAARLSDVARALLDAAPAKQGVVVAGVFVSPGGFWGDILRAAFRRLWIARSCLSLADSSGGRFCVTLW